MKTHLLLSQIRILVLATALTCSFASETPAITFTPPPGAPPRSTSGGAARGTFVPPNNSAPRSTSGGAARGTFVPPVDPAPLPLTNSESNHLFNPPAANLALPQTIGPSRGTFTPPPNNSAPQQIGGGASRANLYGYLPSNTDIHPEAMLAITPDSFYGTTLQAHPTILIYVPASEATSGLFSLKDEAGNTLYQAIVSVPAQPSVIAVQVPAEVALEVDKNYQWFFALLLDDTLNPSTPYVDAWIRRIAPDRQLAQALPNLARSEAAELLAQNGIWYDSVAILTDLRLSEPSNAVINADWQALLNSVGLDAVSAAYAAQ